MAFRFPTTKELKERAKQAFSFPKSFPKSKGMVFEIGDIPETVGGAKLSSGFKFPEDFVGPKQSEQVILQTQARRTVSQRANLFPKDETFLEGFAREFPKNIVEPFPRLAGSFAAEIKGKPIQIGRGEPIDPISKTMREYSQRFGPVKGPLFAGLGMALTATDPIFPGKGRVGKELMEQAVQKLGKETAEKFAKEGGERAIIEALQIADSPDEIFLRGLRTGQNLAKAQIEGQTALANLGRSATKSTPTTVDNKRVSSYTDTVSRSKSFDKDLIPESQVLGKIDLRQVQSEDMAPGIIDELMEARAGKRYPIRDTEGYSTGMVGKSSTFPDWIPKELRKKEVLRNVVTHLQQGTIPKKTQEVRLYNEIFDRVNFGEPIKTVEEAIVKPLISQRAAKDSFLQVTTRIEDTVPPGKPPIKPPKTPKNPQLVEGAENFKDISGFKGQARDVYRNFQAFFKDKFSTVKKSILDPFDASKGKYVDDVKQNLDELKTNVVDGLGIKKGSKESAAVMDYGEKLITRDDLVKRFGIETAEKIVKADDWFRKKYDTLLDEVNAVMKQIYPNDPTKIIPRRKDYYRHFQELGGLEGLKNIFETPAAIDPLLVGVSEFTKPKSKFLSFAQKRLGMQSSRDAVGGFLEYVPAAVYAKHINPHIKKFRGLAGDLSIQTQQSKNANNFIEFLQDYANDLAGKTSAADRFVQKVIPGGRQTLLAIDWLNKRVKANTILGNASSSVAQIFNVPQGVASAKLYSVPGAIKTMGSIFTKNVPMEKSSFLKERYMGSMFNVFEERMLAKPKIFAVWMITAMDEVGTKFIWNSHYAKAVSQKIDNPIKYADDATRALVAGRGIGEVPLLQKSKLFQIVAPFQLEVGNLWYVMGDMVKKKDFAGIATLFVMNFLFNRVAEKVRGSDVVFDPINSVYEGYMALQQEEDKGKGLMKFGGRQIGEVFSNVPGGQTLASLYPEYGLKAIGGLTREELFGEGDPTRYGSGLLSVKGLKDPLFKVLPPFGGGQLKKSLQGTGAFMKGFVTNKEGEVQYDIEQNPQNFLRSILFGKYSSPEAREHFDTTTKEKKEDQLTPEEERMFPIYQEAQKLLNEGREYEAQEMVEEMSEQDYEVYRKLLSKEKSQKKEELKPQMLELYKDARILLDEGREDEANALVEPLSDLEYETYKDVSKKYKETKTTELLETTIEEKKKEKITDERSFIKDVAIYAQAIGTDPVTAFNRIFTGQKIRKLENKTIIVERMPLTESQSLKKKQGATDSMRLDHFIPLQLGGSNNLNNLKLVSEEEWDRWTKVENQLGRLLRAGKISRKDAQRLIKEFKEGKIKEEDIPNG